MDAAAINSCGSSIRKARNTSSALGCIFGYGNQWEKPMVERVVRDASGTFHPRLNCEGDQLASPATKAGCPIQARLWLEWDVTALDVPYLVISSEAEGFAVLSTLSEGLLSTNDRSTRREPTRRSLSCFYPWIDLFKSSVAVHCTHLRAERGKIAEATKFPRNLMNKGLP